MVCMNKTAFTLIELLTTVAIIGILAAIGFVSMQAARNRADDGVLIAAVKEVGKAMELARDQFTGNYPTYSNEFAAGIGLKSADYLAGWQSGVRFASNMSDNKDFCIYARLVESTDGEYFVVSPNSVGHRASAPTLGSCDPS